MNKKVGEGINLLRITRVTATNIIAADVTTGTVRDTRTIHPRTNTKLADTRVLEMIDPNLLEVEIDLMERGAETQNVDDTDIARRPETNRQGHMGSSLRYRTQRTMRLDRLLRP